MNFGGLEKRVRILEQTFRAAEKPCICRVDGETTFHSAHELEAIMRIPCPLHVFRELGRFKWLSSGLPLRSDDQQFCSCAPSILRDYLQGRKGTLNQLEIQQAESAWERTYGPGSEKTWSVEQSLVRQLIQRYEQHKSLNRRTNGKNTM